jgi:hypothetical protein
MSGTSISIAFCTMCALMSPMHELQIELARRTAAGGWTDSSSALPRYIAFMNVRRGVKSTWSTPRPSHTTRQFVYVRVARKPLSTVIARQRRRYVSTSSLRV